MKNLLLCAGLLCLAAPLCAQSAAAPGGVTCSLPSHPKTDADKAFAAEHFAEAEALYTTQLSASPSEAAWIGLVHSQIEQDKVMDALANARRATAALPKSAAMLALTGDAELRAAHIDEANAAYAQARTMDPCLAAAHYGVARMLQLSAMHASALKELAFAHRLAPSDPAISEALFMTLPPAMQAKGLRNLLAATPDLPVAHRQRLEQQAALLEAGATCHPPQMEGGPVPLTPIFFNGTIVRDYALHVSTPDSIAINLELDSTASGIVLSDSDAKKLKVKPAVDGQATVPYLGYVDSLKIASTQYGKCAVSVVPDAVLGNRYSVIGTSFFHDFKIHLDWVAKLMTLTPYPGPTVFAAESAPMDATTPDNEKTWAHALIDDGRVLVAARVEKRPVGLIMIDTSRELEMISPLAAAPFKAQPEATLHVEGVSGQMVRIFGKDGSSTEAVSSVISKDGKNVPIKNVGNFLAVSFAGNQPPNFQVYSFDISAASHAAGLEVGGIVGYHVLRQYFIDFDYRNGLVNLKYDEGFPQRDEINRSE
jgi:hypothetical protein